MIYVYVYLHQKYPKGKAKIKINFRIPISIGSVWELSYKKSQITVIVKSSNGKLNIQNHIDNVIREIETLRMNKNKYMPKHFLVKLQKLQDKEKTLKGIRGNSLFNSMERVDFSHPS